MNIVLWVRERTTWTLALLTGFCLAVWFTVVLPVLVWAQEELTDIDAVKEVIEVANVISAGGLGVVGTIAVIATALTKLLKWKRLGGLVSKLPKGWRFMVPVVITAIGGFFTDVYSGTPLVNALFMVATAGPLSTFLHARASSVADTAEGK